MPFKNKPIYCRLEVDKIVNHKDGTRTVRLVNDKMGMEMRFDTEDETITKFTQAGVQFKWGRIPWSKQTRRNWQSWPREYDA